MAIRFPSSVLALVLLAALLSGGCAQAAPAAPPPSEVPAAPRVQVDRLSFTPRSDGAGLVVRLHTDDLVQGFRAPRRTEDGVIEFVVFNAAPSASFRKDAPVAPVTRADVQREGEHLVIRLALQPDAEVELQAYRDGSSRDLLLSLSSGATPRPVEQPTADQGERWTLDTIVLDAGHGGKDPGTVGNGLYEKNIVLNVTRLVGRYLEEQLPGVRVIYTRTDDTFIPLDERGQIANEAGGKLFVSIHANAAGSSRAYGAETYFLGLHRSASAQRVMERENSVVQLEDDPGRYEDLSEQALITRTLAQSAYLRQSELLAEFIQQQFEERVQRHNRGVKQAGFRVLWGASMPAVLIELGFVSNAAEARFLGSEAGQTYLASAIFRAIRDFKEEYDRGLRPHPPQHAGGE